MDLEKFQTELLAALGRPAAWIANTTAAPYLTHRSSGVSIASGCREAHPLPHHTDLRSASAPKYHDVIVLGATTGVPITKVDGRAAHKCYLGARALAEEKEAAEEKLAVEQFLGTFPGFTDTPS
jgi:hypothetical protein